MSRRIQPSLNRFSFVVALSVTALALACSSGGSTDRPATGGSPGAGGVVSATGGSSASGGVAGGTAPGSGGVGGKGEGGATARAGAGGTTTTSGKGGAVAGGGTSGGSGGEASSAGGRTGGGATGTQAGGTSGSGGTGGAAIATGGSSTSTGGTAGATGGSTGGTSGVTNPSGYPMPPGSANVPRPSGSPGNITVLNWAGFKGAVSYTFDDNTTSQIAAYSTLQGLGVPMTFYLWTGRTEATNAVWAQAVKDGHEIGNHSKSHSSTPPGGADDVKAATQFIEQNLKVTPTTMAAPNGAAVYTSLAPNAGMMINRGVNNAIVKPNDNSDRFTLPCYIPPTNGTAAANLNPEVDSARSAGGWRVVLIHGFTGGTDGAFQPVPLQEFVSTVNHAKSLGDMWIGRVDDIGSYWLGQKAISSATKSTSGDSTTWTWTLPSNFAKGKHVRITVPGGTVTQKGTAIPWDPHGFYEIALDAGSVTVGP